MFYLNVILITFVVDFVVDYSGIIQTVRPWINRLLRREPDSRIKPLDCSLCLSFWLGLTYAILAGVSFPRVAFVCLAASQAHFWGSLLFLLKDALDAIGRAAINWIDRHAVEDEENSTF